MIVPKGKQREGAHSYIIYPTGSNKGVYVQNTHDFIYPSPKGIQIVLVSVEADKKD